jgi:hypothetical protein
MGYVYVLEEIGRSGNVKIGYTDRDPEARLKEIQKTGNPYELRVAYSVEIDNAYTVEQKIHKYFKQKGLHARLEWFNCTVEEAVIGIRDVIGLDVIIQENLKHVNVELIGLNAEERNAYIDKEIARKKKYKIFEYGFYYFILAIKNIYKVIHEIVIPLLKWINPKTSIVSWVVLFIIVFLSYYYSSELWLIIDPENFMGYY